MNDCRYGGWHSTDWPVGSIWPVKATSPACVRTEDWTYSLSLHMQFEQTWCQRADTPEHTPHCSGDGHHMADVVTVCAIPWETLQQWAHIPSMFNVSMPSDNCNCILVHSKATHYTTHFNSIHAVKWRMWGSSDSWLWRLPSSTIWCSTVWYKFQ